VADSGVAVGGARAIALAIAVAWQRRFPLWPWRIPGAPWLLDRLYGVVARLRHRLPGTTPWCAAHPDECDDDPATEDGAGSAEA
jgi:predicted DCC family thiol-disulfide oxidoreductase YuxK